MARSFCACPPCLANAEVSDQFHSYAIYEAAPLPAAGQPSNLVTQPGSVGDPLQSGYYWQGPVTYSFATAASDYEPFYTEAAIGFSAVSSAQRQAISHILESGYGSVESLTLLSLQEVASPADGSVNGADIRIGQSWGARPTAHAYYPSPDAGGQAGDIWFGDTHDYRNPVQGSYEWFTHIHELGHALGLKHGHETDVYGALPANRDSIEFSVMTYRSYVGGPANFYRAEEFGGPQTLMMYDIAALQELYGANYATNAGDTVYAWSATTGEMSVNGVGQGAPGANRIFLTIWDGGGNDTYDFSSQPLSSSGQVNVIDLRPGSWTSLFTQRATLESFDSVYAQGNVYNALLHDTDARSYIENAIGTVNGDTIYGNDVGNRLWGGGGDDVLSGGAGDFLYGGDGLDSVWYNGATGPLVIDLAAGTVAGLPAEMLPVVDGFEGARGSVGADTMFGTSGTDTLDGDAGNDTIYGGAGNDFISADSGIDTLFGGDGNDVYRLSAQSVIDETSASAGGHDVVLLEGIGFVLPEGVEDAIFVRGSGVTIVGNAGDNVLSSQSGFVDLYGGAGDDTLQGPAAKYGGDGNDTFQGAGSHHGGAGDDLYLVTPHGGWVAIEAENGGRDVVRILDASISLELYPHIEVVELTGSASATVMGNASDNTLSGNAGVNTFYGGAGDDLIMGFDGDDYLVGGPGLDTLIGGGGDDTLVLSDPGDVVVEIEGGGTDTVETGFDYSFQENIEAVVLKLLAGGPSTITANGGAGNDFMTVGNSAQGQAYVVYGGGGDDHLSAGYVGTSAGKATLWGGDGNDTLLGRSLFGGAGDDVYIYDTSQAPSYLSEAIDGGTDTVISTFAFTIPDNIENGVLISEQAQVSRKIVGNNLDNTITGVGSLGFLVYGGGGNDVLIGNAGNDDLDGGAGLDTLRGGAGNDTYHIDQTGDVVDETSAGSGGNDVVFIDSGQDLDWAAMPGVERFFLNTAFTAAISTLHIDDGVGRIVDVYGGGAAVVHGGAGDDTITSGSSAILYGGDGDDVLAARVAGVTLYGGDGNDVLEGSAVAETLFGGAGVDIGRWVSGPAVVDMIAHTVLANGVIDVVEGIEGFVGGLRADTFFGDDGENYFYGGFGFNTFYGGGGNDLFADGGLVDYSATAGAIRLDMAAGTAASVDGIDALSSIEAVAGSAFDDTLSGSGAGHETLYGGGGGDTLSGLGGDDELGGGSGNDLIDGGAGSDRLYGDAGDDTLIGGDGEDRFVFRPGVLGSGTDLILDFSVLGDRIDVGAFGYSSLADMHAAGGGIVQDGADVVLTIAVGNAPVVARLLGVQASHLTASRFVFNKAPIAVADSNGTDSVREAGVNADYTLLAGDDSATGNVLANDTDADPGDSKTVTTTGTFRGTYGTLVLEANGAWTYTLDNSDPDTNALMPGQFSDVFSYTMQDGAGAISSSTLTVVIVGTIDRPTSLSTIEAQGVTQLSWDWNLNRYFLEGGSFPVPVLKYSGQFVILRQFGDWSPIAAEAADGGYYVAWKIDGTDQYTVWRTDSSGNHVSSPTGLVSGGSFALKALEDTFQQDLNSDGIVGLPTALIEMAGATGLLAKGDRYIFDNSSTPDVTLSYLGTDYIAGQFGGWTPIGAEAAAGGGYNVAWKVAGADQYTVWHTDSGGNYASSLIGFVSGGSYALQSLEDPFAQDLNGDGTIGLTTSGIESDGATDLIRTADRYFFEAGGTVGPSLKYLGVFVTAGEFGAWAPIGAEAAAGGGYDVAWKMTGVDQYTVWRTDSDGNYASSLTGFVSGGDPAIAALEAGFNQDLNGDGTLGVALTQIEAAGVTSLSTGAGQYFLADGGTIGPTLKYLGVTVAVGSLGGWAPIGAEASAGGGYDVAWKMAGADQYTVWHADSSGNYASSLVGFVSGGSHALQALEDIFAQDLNGDGTTGLTTLLIESAGATDLLRQADRYVVEAGGAVGPSLQYLGAIVTAGSLGGWAPIGVEASAGGGYDVAWKMAGADQYTVWHTNVSGNYASSVVGFVSGGSYALQSLEDTFAQDLNGDGTIGVALTAIESAGATGLSTGASRYFLQTGGTPGPTLKYLGADFIVVEAGGWTPISAEASAGGGYDVAWKMAGADQYTVWHADSSGNYASSLVGVVSGGSYALQSLESIFAQDLNGDGTTGLATSQIEAAGATRLIAQADRYVVETGGTVGPSLKYLGETVAAGSLGGWAPIGAEAAAGGGYDVAWKMAGADQYTVWHTDSDGNYASSLIGFVSGSNPALIALEARFAQDLNGNGLTFVGGVVDDAVSGGEHNDTLYGGDGNDRMEGNGGADTLYGGDRNDQLFGDVGNDYLVGGLGDDILTGGTGADLFSFTGGEGHDIITDFSPEEGDGFEYSFAGTSIIITVSGEVMTIDIDGVISTITTPGYSQPDIF